MQRQDLAAELRRQARMLRDQAWVIVLCVAISMAAAAIYTSTRTETFTAQTRLLLQQDDPNSLVLGTQGVYVDPIRQRATDIDLVKSPRLAARVARDLHLKKTQADEPFTGIQASAVGDSNILTISVSKDTSNMATRMADAFATEYVQFRRDLARTRYDKALADVRRQIAASKARGASAAQIQALKRQADALQLFSGVRLSDATIVQNTQGRFSRNKPGLARNMLLAGLFGLFVGLVIAIVRDRLDDRFKSEEDIAEILPDVPILATVPTRRRGQGWRRSAAESYHNLRVNLKSSGGGTSDNGRGGPLSILVTSGMGRDGKTTTAVNLGLALTEEGRAALLVDADLRRPRVTELVHSPRGAGVVNVLAGESALEDAAAVHKLEPNGNGLRLGNDPAVTVRGDIAVLPAGRTTVPPQKLINDESVVRLLDQAREAGRPIVIDGPPLGLFGDMLPVAKHVDAVVIVIRLYHSRRRSIQTLLRQLHSAGVVPLGIVVLGGQAREQAYYGA